MQQSDFNSGDRQLTVLRNRPVRKHDLDELQEENEKQHSADHQRQTHP